VDPTAKPDKNSLSSNGDAQTATGAQPAGGQQTMATPSQNAAADQNSASSVPNGPNQVAVVPTVSPTVSAPMNTARASSGSLGASPATTAPTATTTATTALQYAPVQSSPVQSSAPVARPPVQAASPAPVRNPSPHVPASEMAGIPSSLKSQIASTTPEMSGTKPDDAVRSLLEPVSLPESAIRGLLAQAPNPEYPASAKASAQQGSVVLQVLIGPDGAVQDAKFMQGSFVFARAAIDAVKRWRFKPYSMNGQAVSVQSVITLNFKPPA
jgi:TonB family protein